MTSRREGTLTTRGRRGFFLVEIAAAALALAIAMTMTLQVVGWAAAERRAVQRRERATRAAANALERLTARPWASLTPEAIGAERLEPSAVEALPGGTLEARAVEVSDDVGEARRITVEVRWKGRGGVPEAPVRLTAWVYRRGGQEEASL